MSFQVISSALKSATSSSTLCLLMERGSLCSPQVRTTVCYSFPGPVCIYSTFKDFFFLYDAVTAKRGDPAVYQLLIIISFLSIVLCVTLVISQHQ